MQNGRLGPGAQDLVHGAARRQRNRDGAGLWDRSVLYPLPQLVKKMDGLAAVASPAVAKTGHAVVTVEVGDVGKQLRNFLVIVQSAGGGD